MSSSEPGAGRSARAVRLVAGLVVLLLLSLVPTLDQGVAADVPENPAATQPVQPATGPGGSHYRHAGVRVTSGGSGADAWYAFEPRSPRPATAPVAIVLHGYYEFAGHAALDGLIRHTVRRGTIVVYPRWQTDALTPCPGPFDVQPCLDAALAGIRGALHALRTEPGHVRPRLDQVSYWGSSFGGIIATDLANRHAPLGLPRPRVLFLDDPHDGGYAGPGEPALDDSLAGIPASTRVECHSGADGVIAEAGKEMSSCNAIFPLLGQVPARNKDLVLTHTDTHGEPDLSSQHMVCYSPPGQVDAYDYGFCWRDWDALRMAARTGTYGPLVSGDTPERRSLGTWSDGVPVAPLVVQEVGPLVP